MLYLARFEGVNLVIDTKLSYSNLTREELLPVKSLRGYPSVIIKKASVIWNSFNGLVSV